MRVGTFSALLPFALCVWCGQTLAAPVELRFKSTDMGPATPWVFVMPETGVVDAGTRPPDGPGDLCYAFMCFFDTHGLMVTVATFDDDVSTDSCKTNSTSCPAWDDDAVEVFLDGECARLPDSRADGGVHLKHGGEFALVANGAAMSDFSGYRNSFVPLPDGGRRRPEGFGTSTNALWTGVVRRDGVMFRDHLLALPDRPASFAPDGTHETDYMFYFPWAAMGRTNRPDRIGFNIGVQDDDGGGRRDHALYWTGNPRRPFSDESAFGTLILSP